MLKITCLCGEIRCEIKMKPDFIHECNCTLCRKSGASWAYFHPSEVRVEGRTNGYSRDDKDDPGAEIQFCPRCGSTTHFTLTASAVAKFGNVQMGVNMRLADESELAGIEMRYPDGRAWPGEGEFGYVREARIIGRG
ncbi:MAG: aldehyde-activating protein [Sphingomonadales bacterium]|nr:MAG: aldehyde-activating protein [Sphingomonadales bacterium]